MNKIFKSIDMKSLAENEYVCINKWSLPSLYNLSTSALRVFLRLLEDYNEDRDEFNFSKNEVKNDLKITSGTLKRALNELVDAKIIKEKEYYYSMNIDVVEGWRGYDIEGNDSVFLDFWTSRAINELTLESRLARIAQAFAERVNRFKDKLGSLKDSKID